MKKLYCIMSKPYLIALAKVLKSKGIIQDSEVQAIRSYNFNKLKTISSKDIKVKILIAISAAIYITITYVIMWYLSGESEAILCDSNVNHKIRNMKEGKIKDFLTFLFTKPDELVTTEPLINTLILEVPKVFVLNYASFLFAKLNVEVYGQTFLTLIDLCKFYETFKYSKDSFSYCKFLHKEDYEDIKRTIPSITDEEIREISQDAGKVTAIVEKYFSHKDPHLKAMNTDQLQNAIEFDKSVKISEYLESQALKSKFVYILARRLTFLIASKLHAKDKVTLAFLLSMTTTVLILGLSQYLQFKTKEKVQSTFDKSLNPST